MAIPVRPAFTTQISERGTVVTLGSAGRGSATRDLEALARLRKPPAATGLDAHQKGLFRVTASLKTNEAEVIQQLQALRSHLTSDESFGAGVQVPRAVGDAWEALRTVEAQRGHALAQTHGLALAATSLLKLAKEPVPALERQIRATRLLVSLLDSYPKADALARASHLEAARALVNDLRDSLPPLVSAQESLFKQAELDWATGNSAVAVEKVQRLAPSFATLLKELERVASGERAPVRAPDAEGLQHLSVFEPTSEVSTLKETLSKLEQGLRAHLDVKRKNRESETAALETLVEEALTQSPGSFRDQVDAIQIALSEMRAKRGSQRADKLGEAQGHVYLLSQQLSAVPPMARAALALREAENLLLSAHRDVGDVRSTYRAAARTLLRGIAQDLVGAAPAAARACERVADELAPEKGRSGSSLLRLARDLTPVRTLLVPADANVQVVEPRLTKLPQFASGLRSSYWEEVSAQSGYAGRWPSQERAAFAQRLSEAVESLRGGRIRHPNPVVNPAWGKEQVVLSWDPGTNATADELWAALREAAPDLTGFVAERQAAPTSLTLAVPLRKLHPADPTERTAAFVEYLNEAMEGYGRVSQTHASAEGDLTRLEIQRKAPVPGMVPGRIDSFQRATEIPVTQHRRF